jgi:hypothetical protein
MNSIKIRKCDGKIFVDLTSGASQESTVENAILVAIDQLQLRSIDWKQITIGIQR